jgi:mono/diheme cytochrome c family protein
MIRFSPIAMAAALAASAFAQSASAADSKPASAAVKRGAYLVGILGCHDCHTPLKMGPKGPEPDMTRAFSGHPQELVMPPAPKLPEGPWLWMGAATNTAFAGPWGVSYASNLTADKDTGMGKWKAEEFVAAIKTGKHAGVSRPIMPPMPWQAYKNLSDADLKAVFAYLQAQPAIKNQVPQYQPPAKP